MSIEVASYDVPIVANININVRVIILFSFLLSGIIEKHLLIAVFTATVLTYLRPCELCGHGQFFELIWKRGHF